MNARLGWTIVVVLAIVIIVLAFLLVAGSAPTQEPGSTVTPGTAQPFVSENVKVTSPLPNAEVPRTFTVVGEARGIWYFEASFPVQVRDPQNNLVGQGIAQASANWMTEDFVPFTAPVTVTSYSGPAILIFLKDNPSGLPENDDAVFFPIVVQ